MKDAPPGPDLRILADRKGFPTLRALADAAGLDDKYVSLMNRGTIPGADARKSLCRALKVSEEELIAAIRNARTQTRAAS